MFSFQFELNTKIICEANAVSKIGKEVKGLGISKILIVTDKGLIQAGVVEQVEGYLKRENIEYEIYDAVVPNPTISTINGYNRYLSIGCNGVLAIGGGSSIDTAKGIAILATNGGRIEDYFGAFKVMAPSAPLIAIPTTAGTGSEVSTQISVKDDKTHTKSAVRSYLAQAANLPMAPHFIMEISLQVLCAIPNSLILENVIGGSLSEMGVLENPLQPVNGYMYPPQEPGHGVRFIKEELQKYELTSEKLREIDLRIRK